MKEKQLRTYDFEEVAWGLFFVWWGITELFPALPNGSGPLGIGLILLGVNAARHFSGEAPSRFSITLGILAVVWGGLELAGVIFKLPIELPVFAVLLIVLGAMILAPGLFGGWKKLFGGL